ncbi:Tyrosine recombinase XerD [subsurface metagenome]
MIKTINETEINNLLLSAKEYDIREFTMIYLALSTGLRCSELTGLFIEDVAPFEGVSRILIVPTRIGKNGKKRDIPINQETQAVLAHFLHIKASREEFINSDSFLFVSRFRKKPLSPRDFQRIVHNLSVSSIGRSITPHILRHTFATRLMKHTNLRVVQEILGHSRIQTTQIYTHVNSDDTRAAINNFKLPHAAR